MKNSKLAKTSFSGRVNWRKAECVDFNKKLKAGWKPAIAFPVFWAESTDDEPKPCSYNEAFPPRIGRYLRKRLAQERNTSKIVFYRHTYCHEETGKEGYVLPFDSTVYGTKVRNGVAVADKAVVYQKGSNRQIGDRPKTNINFRIDSNLLESLREKAKQCDRPMVHLVEEALVQYLQSSSELQKSPNIA